jgi:hypothetical protein
LKALLSLLKPLQMRPRLLTWCTNHWLQKLLLQPQRLLDLALTTSIPHVEIHRILLCNPHRNFCNPPLPDLDICSVNSSPKLKNFSQEFFQLEDYDDPR